MKAQNFFTTLILMCSFSFVSQAQLFRPYKCGPVLKKDHLQLFDTLNQYLGIRPGDTFAEIGASSGYFNGAMAVYLDNVTFYLQDIDRVCLNRQNLKKVLRYYSRFKEKPISETNDFHIIIGTDVKTNLPKSAIDIIYSNATFHVLDYPDSILADLYGSLKDDGRLSIRDEFAHGSNTKYCGDKKCGKPLVRIDDFMNAMKRNGFVLIDESDRFGYPIYTFEKDLDLD